jgi:hypothetical protein
LSNARVEPLFRPSETKEFAVQLVGDGGFSAARFEDIAFEEREPAQHRQDVAPLLRVGRRQNRQAVAPFVDLVAIRNIRWDKGLIRHPAIVGALPFVR